MPMLLRSTGFVETTLNHLGPHFCAMVGAKEFTHHSGGRGALSFRFGGKAKCEGGRVNYCKISLNELDLYDVEYGWIYALTYTPRKVSKNVFAEDLSRDFERNTGLYTSL